MSNQKSKLKVLSVDERWELSIPHEAQSLKLMEAVLKADKEYGGKYLNFNEWAEGDNGKHLLYLLDIHFNPTGKSDPTYKPCPERYQEGVPWGPCDGTCSDVSCDADK